MTPSSRSITPPCPGISRLASLTPKRRLTADFEQVAELRADRDAEAEEPDAQRVPADHEPGEEQPDERRRRRARRSAPDQVLPGLTAGQSLRAADPPADEVGADVGRHHHEHQPEDQQHPLGLAVARRTSSAPIASVM